MKIGFDGKRAIQNHTGLGNYSRFIVDILSQNYPQNEYILYAPQKRDNKELNKIIQKRNAKIIYPQNTFWKKLSSIWRMWGIISQIKKDKIDLFHGLSNELPISIKKGGTKSIVTIHDLIFYRYPHFYTWIDRHIYSYKFRKACQNCDRIIAVSEMTKQDIISYWKINPDKIDVVYQGCDASFKKELKEAIKKELKEKYDLPDKYILYVGSIESRKNLLVVAKALKNIESDVQLVAIGKYTPYVKRIQEYIKQNNLEHRVKFFHKIQFNELPYFYQMASVFAYPSYFEGFGIPILEALNSGVPVIAATGSCLEEAGGPNSIYIHPDDNNEFAKQINLILNSPSVANQMISAGKEYAKLFNEEKLSKDLMAVYQKTLLQKNKYD